MENYKQKHVEEHNVLHTTFIQNVDHTMDDTAIGNLHFDTYANHRMVDCSKLFQSQCMHVHGVVLCTNM